MYVPQEVDNIGPLEPVKEPEKTQNSPQFRLPEGTYAEIPVRFHNTNDPFAAPLIHNEDELQDIGKMCSYFIQIFKEDEY